MAHVPPKVTVSKAGPRRLAILTGLLALVGAAFLGTAGYRQQLLAETRALRRDVEQVEADRRAREELKRKRGERARLLEQLAQKPQDFDLLIRTGALYGQDSRYEDALFLYHEARRLRPDRAEPYRALQEAYITTRRYDRAYDACTEGLKRVPDDLELTLGLIHLDTLVGWNNHARAHLAALKNSSHRDSPRVLIASALVHRQVADSKHAEKELRAAAERDPRNSKVYALLSGVQWETGNAEGAEANIRKALELEPENADYLMQLADIERGKRTPEGIAASIKVAERALEVSPGNRFAFFTIAEALLDQKKTEEARKILEGIHRRYPEFTKASLALGKLYVRDGRTAEGKRLMEEYTSAVREGSALKGAYFKVGMQRDQAGPHIALSHVLFEEQEPEKAILVLRHALTLEPNNSEAKRQLGRALVAAGRGGEYGELVRHPHWHLPEMLDQGKP